MPYVGILATAGLLLCLPLVCLAIVRFKDLRLRRMLGILEWLAINTGRRRAANTLGADSDVAELWDRAHWVFSSSPGAYLRLVWHAGFRDLYWANRFGTELQHLSLFPLPQEAFRRDDEASRRREELVTIHIRDFVILAQGLLLPHWIREVGHGER